MATRDISDFQVLNAQNRWSNNRTGPWAYEILAKETGECPKVCFRAMERAITRGLMDCGVSLRTAWITERGAEILRQGIEAAKEQWNASADEFNQWDTMGDDKREEIIKSYTALGDFNKMRFSVI